VFAEASAANKCAVFAVNDNASGFAVYFRGRLGVSTLAGGGDVWADANGVLVIGGSSDARLKKNVAALSDEMDVLAALAQQEEIAAQRLAIDELRAMVERPARQ
jgi:hypothetical protein